MLLPVNELSSVAAACEPLAPLTVSHDAAASVPVAPNDVEEGSLCVPRFVSRPGGSRGTSSPTRVDVGSERYTLEPLWEGAKWKPVSIGDLLETKAVTKYYRKASIVVHPDRTGNLDHEKRFIAKRIFDALAQAKTEFDAENS